MTDVIDVAIIGSGPVGQHAALKCALLEMSAIVIDRGRRHSRAFFTPRIANIPTMPGISGGRLLELQRDELKKHSDRVKILDDTEVTDIVKDGVKFKITCRGEDVVSDIHARNVILATGVVDRQPEIGGSILPILPFADKGIVMYCMLCDGHFVSGKDVCVLGHSAQAAAIAIDLHYFGPSSVTLLTHGKDIEDPGIFDRLSESNIPVITDEIMDLTGLRENQFGAVMKSGAIEYFDVCFVALGWYSMGTKLGIRLGSHTDDDGYLVTNEDGLLLDDKQTPIDHLFAIGDVRNTWNQIPIGWGDAEKAVIFIWANYI